MTEAPNEEFQHEKQMAYGFLLRLQQRLNTSLLGPSELRSAVGAIWKKPRDQKSPDEKLACKENVFLYHFVLQQIFNEVMSIGSMNAEEARRSIRCEYHAKFPGFSVSNARRREGHPFSKKPVLTAASVMETWTKPPGESPVNQAHPDLGLSSPFPFKIVFDAKFFEQESSAAAETALVEGVYETVYYRGLPRGPGWDYDFGCLLAYDASTSGNLQKAWDKVIPKSVFWADANVFVMVLRGGQSGGQVSHSQP